MTITSMSNYDLYKTLMGYNYGEKDAKPEELKEASEGEKVDISKAVVPPEKLEKFSIEKGTPVSGVKCEKNFDRLELSSGIKFADIRDPSHDLDFNDREVRSYINAQRMIAIYDGSAKGGAAPTKEKIAEYYGNIAKRLDNAYAEGKFTEEEYDYLNKGIAERMEDTTRKAEETIAFGKVGYRRSMSMNDTLKQIHMDRGDYLAERSEEIRRYADNFCIIDRTELLRLFNSFRYGK